MDNALTYNEALKIAEAFAQKVHDELDPQAEIYLFGSVVRGENRSKSDIDIAVLSKVFTGDVCNNYAIVSLLAYGVNSNIDAQAIIYEDWISMTPFTSEVKRQGVLVAP